MVYLALGLGPAYFLHYSGKIFEARRLSGPSWNCFNGHCQSFIQNAIANLERQQQNHVSGRCLDIAPLMRRYCLQKAPEIHRRLTVIMTVFPPSRVREVLVRSPNSITISPLRSLLPATPLILLKYPHFGWGSRSQNIQNGLSDDESVPCSFINIIPRPNPHLLPLGFPEYNSTLPQKGIEC